MACVEAVPLSWSLDAKHVEAAWSMLKEVREIFTCCQWKLIRLNLVGSEVLLGDSHYMLHFLLMIDCRWIHLVDFNFSFAVVCLSSVLSNQPDLGLDQIHSLLVIDSDSPLHESIIRKHVICVATGELSKGKDKVFF